MERFFSSCQIPPECCASPHRHIILPALLYAFVELSAKERTSQVCGLSLTELSHHPSPSHFLFSKDGIVQSFVFEVRAIGHVVWEWGNYRVYLSVTCSASVSGRGGWEPKAGSGTKACSQIFSGRINSDNTSQELNSSVCLKVKVQCKSTHIPVA